MTAAGRGLALDQDRCIQILRECGHLPTGPVDVVNLEYLYEALDFVAQGKVKTIVETYPLAEASKAYERVAQGKARFRAVLTM